MIHTTHQYNNIYPLESNPERCDLHAAECMLNNMYQSSLENSQHRKCERVDHTNSAMCKCTCSRSVPSVKYGFCGRNRIPRGPKQAHISTEPAKTHRTSCQSISERCNATLLHSILGPHFWLWNTLPGAEEWNYKVKEMCVKVTFSSHRERTSWMALGDGDEI